MSDHADSVESNIYRTIAADLAAARRAPLPQPDCRCHICDDPITVEFLFCNKECTDDFQCEFDTVRRSGKSRV